MKQEPSFPDTTDKMAERTIHKCPSCNQSYLGNVCESCFESAPEVEQTAFITEYLKNFDQYHQDNPRKYAPIPGVDPPIQPSSFSAPIISGSLPAPVLGDDDYDYSDNDDIDLVDIIPEPKPTLKAFQIKVYEGEHKGEPVIADIILILSIDLETAFSQCGYKPNRFTLEGKEIKGPFKSGFVLSSWDD